MKTTREFLARIIILLLYHITLHNWNAMGAPYGSEEYPPHRRYSIKHKQQPIQDSTTSDIIAGKDFLSLVISASAVESRRQDTSLRTRSRTRARTTSTTSTTTTTSTTSTPSPTTSTTVNIVEQKTTTTTETPGKLSTVENDLITDESEQHPTVIRDSRSSVFSYQLDYDNGGEKDHPYYASLNAAFDEDNNVTDNANEGKILAISTSTSVGINVQNDTDELETATNYKIDENEDNSAPLIKSYEHTNARVSQSSKTVLNVDEIEPITLGNNNNNNNPLKILQDSLKQETSRQQAQILGANPDYLEQQRYKELQQQQQQRNQPYTPQQQQHPYHQTIVFHGQSTKDGNGRGRSVSYSSIIQNVGPPPAASESQPRHNWEHASESIERPQFVQNTHAAFNKDASYESHLPARLESSTTTAELSTSQQQQQQQQQSGIPRWRQQPHYLEYEHNYNIHNSPTTPKYLPTVYATPEQNYEVDESVSVMTNGRTYGIQPAQQPAQPQPQPQPQPQSQPLPQQPLNTQAAPGDDGQQQTTKTDDPNNNANNNHKVGYVVEGRNFRKYRVEERTSDGFIVGEYGVVSHDDGSLRGVRYTADGTINPRLIYDALMKFLSL